MDAAAAAGMDLGRRVTQYNERDAILYALAVGAGPNELDLIYENQLRVMPTFALTFGLWAADELGGRGFFDSRTALHGAQRFEALMPLPPAGEIETTAKVVGVWDKGGAAVYDIEVSSRAFRAVYSIFAPGFGGWGGERGLSAPTDPDQAPDRRLVGDLDPRQAVLYRLTGDRHAIHIDPEAAATIGQPAPIMHGLCTLATTVMEVAKQSGRHVCDLTQLAARFAGPAFPGEEIEIEVWDQPQGDLKFAVKRQGAAVLSAGSLAFDDAETKEAK